MCGIMIIGEGGEREKEGGGRDMDGREREGGRERRGKRGKRY